MEKYGLEQVATLTRMAMATVKQVLVVPTLTAQAQEPHLLQLLTLPLVNLIFIMLAL